MECIANAAAHPDRGPVLLQDFSRDPQAQSGALLASGGEEGLKQVGHEPRGDSLAIIAYGNNDTSSPAF